MTRRFSNVLVLALAGWLAVQMSSRAAVADTALTKSAVLESNVAYLQVSRVGKNLPDEIRAAQSALAVSNKIAGTILDLRFADGDEPESAKATADLFTSRKSPLAILINARTLGAAETLASELRAARAGLVFESDAGLAKTNGETVSPDQLTIVVPVGPEDERALMRDPYAAPVDTNAPAATNGLLPLVDHTSEADLVRARVKDGDEISPVPPSRPPIQQPRVIRDPLLARAVDLIKGLAIVRH